MCICIIYFTKPISHVYLCTDEYYKYTLLDFVVKQGSIQLITDFNQATSGIMVGSVQVYYNDRWGAIRDFTGWSRNHAHIVCRQLGYFSATDESTSCTRCGNVPCSGVFLTNLWETEVQCAGSEELLTECGTRNNWSFGRTCTTSYHAVGVRCAGTCICLCLLYT